jgi:hypothetical protein
MRLNVEGANPANEAIRFYNNLWSDPTGTMEDFSDTPAGETASFVLENNLYWNGGAALPADPGETVKISDDPRAIVGDPGLPSPSGVVPPRWDPATGRFADGSRLICEVLRNLVVRYGVPSSAAGRDAALAAESPDHDILRRSRPPGAADVGAYER